MPPHFSKSLRKFLQEKSDLNCNIIIKVNSDANHVVTSSTIHIKKKNFNHYHLLVPEFFVHIIIDDKNPVPKKYELVVIPENLHTDEVVASIIKMAIEGKRITKSVHDILNKPE